MKKGDYFLCSERLGFRWWQPDDYELARALWGNSAVTKLFSKVPWTDTQIRQRLDKEIGWAEQHGVQYWPMFELDGGAHVGCSGLRPYKPEEKIFELGFHLRPEFWSKGYATEAGRTIVNHTFEILDVNAIFAGHHPENSGSRNVLLKLGFEQIGEDLFEPTGLLHPSYMLYKSRG